MVKVLKRPREIAFPVRELSLIRPRGHVVECTVKFVIGASIVALSTVRRKCRFSVSPSLSPYFSVVPVHLPYERSRSGASILSFVSFAGLSDDVNPYRPTFNLSWKYICGSPWCSYGGYIFSSCLLSRDPEMRAVDLASQRGGVAHWRWKMTEETNESETRAWTRSMYHARIHPGSLLICTRATRTRTKCARIWEYDKTRLLLDLIMYPAYPISANVVCYVNIFDNFYAYPWIITSNIIDLRKWTLLNY